MAETLEKRLTRIYAEAAEDLRKKLAKYLARYAAKDAQKRRQRDAGEITEEEYRDWVAGQVFRGNLWRQKVDQATGTLADANAAALQIINGERMGVFAESANYQAYQLTKDTGAAINFSIYDEDAVGRLLKDEPELLPRKKLDRAKDRGWNQKQIAGAVAQGIIQGESVPHLAKRIARDTASKNSGAMIRYARTAITGAQNAGRVETLRRGKALGIRCKKCWLATLDGSTRDSHREMDGQTVDVDEDFHTPLGSKMQYPGDMAGKPADIWNCRCTVTYEYEDYPQENAERIAYVEGVDEDGKPYRRSKLIKDMTYREWLAWRGQKTPKKPKWKETVTNPPNQKTTETESELEKKLGRPVNRFGERIIYSEKIADKQKQLIEDLASEFETKLKEVKTGAQQAAGSVEISGTIMRVSTKSEADVVHEFAHSISIQNQSKFGLYDEKDFWKEIQKVKTEYRKAVGDDTANWISSYEHSSKGLDEFFAEAFTMAIMAEKGLKIPDKYGKDLTYANEVLRITKKYFRKKK